MVINHAEVTRVVSSFLQMNPVFNSAEVVAQMYEASRLNSAEDSLLNDFVCGSHNFIKSSVNEFVDEAFEDVELGCEHVPGFLFERIERYTLK